MCDCERRSPTLCDLLTIGSNDPLVSEEDVVRLASTSNPLHIEVRTLEGVSKTTRFRRDSQAYAISDPSYGKESATSGILVAIGGIPVICESHDDLDTVFLSGRYHVV